MSGRSVEHATFVVERRYKVSPERAFAAWADPEAKARWFVDSEASLELDFRARVGAGGAALSYLRSGRATAGHLRSTGAHSHEQSGFPKLSGSNATCSVGQITAEVLDQVLDSPKAIAESLAPHAGRFGLPRGDGVGLLDHLLTVVDYGRREEAIAMAREA